MANIIPNISNKSDSWVYETARNFRYFKARRGFATQKEKSIKELRVLIAQVNHFIIMLKDKDDNNVPVTKEYKIAKENLRLELEESLSYVHYDEGVL